MTTISEEYISEVLSIFKKSHLVFSPKELEHIEFAHFGLNNIMNEGLNLIIYINTDRYCAKEMVLLPNQACPEHCHPNLPHAKGKQETFRCRWGKVYLYVEGEEEKISPKLPKGNNQEYYTVRKEVILLPGQQYTIDPHIKHWFKAGQEGAVVSEFSSTSYDEYDIFTNPNVKREAQDNVTV